MLGEPARHEPDADWRPSSPESSRLAAWVRTHRLTVVFGPEQAHLTSLLTAGVLPLLGRRTIDAAPAESPPGSGVVLPFPERRNGRHAQRTEVLILFDAASEGSLDQLETRFDASLLAAGYRPDHLLRNLTERVQALAERHHCRFLFVIDGFEALLPALNSHEPPDPLLVQMVSLLNRPVTANLLVAVRADSIRRLGPFVERLHGLEPVFMWLPAPQPTTLGYQAESMIAAPKAPAPLSTHPPTPARAATPVNQTPARAPLAAVPAVRPAEADDIRPHPEDRQAVAPSLPAQHGPAAAPLRGEMTARPRVEASTEPAQWTTATVVSCAAALALVAGIAVWWSDDVPTARLRDAGTPIARDKPRPLLPGPAPMPAPSPAPAPSPSPAPIPSPAPLPRTASAAAPTSLDLLVDSEGTAPPALSTELANALGLGGTLSITPRVAKGMPASLRQIDAPHLAIARYDVLKAAPLPRSLTVIAPLYQEELYVFVRADSPWRYLHELKQRRINAGPATGSRALTADTLYRRMFGAALPKTAAGPLDAATALTLLAEDIAPSKRAPLDAVLVVGAQGRQLMATLPLAQRLTLKLLQLAPDNPASRRALQTYLPATTTGLAGEPVASLASMEFLVGSGRADADTSKLFADVATSLCQRLDGLQRNGDPKWRDVQRGLRLPLSSPTAPPSAAETAWAQCS